MPRLVLIIEDTAPLAASLALAFEEIGNIEAAVFGNGRKALRFLRQEHRILAAVITDLNLPDLDGLALIQQIREMAGQQGVPAILITAQDHFILQPEHSLANPNAILKKPFSMKEVRRVLETLL